MDGDNAVFLLADSATILALDARRLVSFFNETGFVDDVNGVFSGMFLGNDFLQFVPHPLVIPSLLGEKPLHRHSGLQRDRFGVFPGQLAPL